MKKRIAVFVFAALLSNPPVQAEPQGTLVDIENHWAQETIVWAVSSEIVKGYADHRFRPDQPVTESEFISMLVRAFPVAEKMRKQAFIQDPVGNWFTSYYQLAERFNLPVTGKATKPILREEVARLLAATQGFNYNAEGSVAFLLESGISKGRSDRTIQGFEPNGRLTRAEAVQFLRNLADQQMNLEMKKRPTEQQANWDIWKYEKSLKITALGDSLTFGLFLNDTPQQPSKQAFPYLLSDRAKVENLGVTGWSSKDLFDAVQTSKYQAAIKNSNVITITIGSNDLIGVSSQIIKAFQTNTNYQPSEDEVSGLIEKVEGQAEGLQHNLNETILEIRRHSDAPIVLFNLYNPFPNILGLEDIHTLNERAITPMNLVIEGLANPREGIFIADAHGNFEGKQLSLVRVWSLDFHPTVEGQKTLAKSALEVFNSGE